MNLILEKAADGKLYHAEQFEDGSWNFILDETGSLIPASCCLCYAHEPGECVCATTAWKGYRYDDDDEDY